MSEYVYEEIVSNMIIDGLDCSTVRIGERREEIVRCRDCEHCSEEGVYTPEYYCLRHSPLCGVPTQPDGFCAWGVRREDS